MRNTGTPKHIRTFRPLGTFWGRDDSLTIFLTMLVFFVFVIGPLSNVFPNFWTLMEVALAVVLISGIWATIESRKLAGCAVAFVVVGIASSVLKQASSYAYTFSFVSELCEIPALGLFLYVVLK